MHGHKVQYFLWAANAGIGLSNDKVLQSRALSYADTQRYRIGTNYQMLPINAPKCPFHNSHENGESPLVTLGVLFLNYNWKVSIAWFGNIRG